MEPTANEESKRGEVCDKREDDTSQGGHACLRIKPGHGTAPGLGVGGVSLLCPSARRYPTQAPQLTASFSITCHIRILDGSVCISLSLDKSSKLQSIPRPTGVPGWCFLVKKPE